MAGLKFMVRKDRVDAVVTPAERSVPGIPATATPQEVLAEIELLKSADVGERLARETGVSPERLRQGLLVEAVASGRNTTNLIAVRYSSPDREEVARVLGKLPEVYLEKHLSVNRRPGVVEFFRSQMEVWEQQLQAAEEEVAEFQKQLPGVVSEGKDPPTGNRLADTEAALREAESRAAEVQRQLQAMPEHVIRVRQAGDSAYLAQLRSQLLELEQRRTQATRLREIGQLEARIGELREAIAGEAPARVEESVPNPARALLEQEARRVEIELAGLRARRAALAAEDRRRREQAAAARLIAAENSVQLAGLTRQVKAAEENLWFYRKKYAEAREAELLDRSRVLNVSLAEAPRPPVRVEKRSLAFYLGVSGMLALALAASGAFAADRLDHSIHTPRQLEDCSSLAVLACIPEAKRG
jgi:uncharacterized protein involved in exopolysaccharide biosynthesis